ncbi:hypothetical protein QR98_0072860 [Sarcoptes scabiei]|uniref:Uncharacterized protein n=1 Tax=Sarcoptes scabiei TaxID=52283 RepID=A0A132ACR6_SARSC|nr:hypothetical protein QR98_0072860 [Sarcoptes scabiei]
MSVFEPFFIWLYTGRKITPTMRFKIILKHSTLAEIPSVNVVTEMAKNHEQNKIDDSAQNQQVKESSKFGKIKSRSIGGLNREKILNDNCEASWVKDYFKMRKLSPENFYHHYKDCEWKKMIKNQNKLVFIEFLKLCAREYPPKLYNHLPKNIPIDLPE